MPTRSKPMSRARALICRSSPKVFGVALLSCLLLVDAEDFIGLLLHTHRRGVDTIRNGLVERLAFVQESLDPCEAVGLVPQQRTVFRVLGPLVGHLGVHPTANDNPGAAEIAEVVRIEDDAAAGGDDAVLTVGQFANQGALLQAEEGFALRFEIG